MAERCPACGAGGILAIAAPGHRAMLSDGAPRGMALARRHCRACGAGWLPKAADRARAQGYAAGIAALWQGPPPASTLDVGCGNGALLAALGALWPQAHGRGVEPGLRDGMRASLVLAVNVIEHTAGPVPFLAALRRAVAPGGAALVVCPDGTLPWLELLIADHRWSRTPAALARMARVAGLRPAAVEPMSRGFQAMLLRPGRKASLPPPRAVVSPLPRRRYLGAWRALDPALAARGSTGRRLVCFGAGEAAWLLRVHAPGTWSRVAAVTADDAAGIADPGRAWPPAGEVDMAHDEILLAVRPTAQPGLACRLTASGQRVIRWDDLAPR